MQFGRSYEEFEVGATYQHWPGKTVTELDDHLFCLLTMNHHPLHLDRHYAEETTQFGQNVVVGNYVYSILLGMSVADISGKAIANLEIESLRHVAPTFHGDTLYGQTTVLDKWESTSKDDRGVVLRGRLPLVEHGGLAVERVAVEGGSDVAQRLDLEVGDRLPRDVGDAHPEQIVVADHDVLAELRGLLGVVAVEVQRVVVRQAEQVVVVLRDRLARPVLVGRADLAS